MGTEGPKAEAVDVEELAERARVVPAEEGGPVAGEGQEVGAGVMPTKNGKPRRSITAEQYALLVEAFEKKPGVFKHAARWAGVNDATAKKAWEVGFEKTVFGQEAIRDRMEKTVNLARAKVQRQYTEAKAREIAESIETDRLAKEQASEARVDEGLALQFGRKTTKQLLAATASMLPGMRLLADKVNDSLKVHFAEGASTLTLGQIKEALWLVERTALTIRNLSAATETLIESERMHLGEPGKRTAVVVMTKDEAIAEITRANRAMDLAMKGADDDEDVIDLDSFKMKGEG